MSGGGDLDNSQRIEGGTDGTIIGNTSDRLKVTPDLAVGAATSALQTTGNTSLASIDGKLNSLGQKTASGSVPVVLASDQNVNISFSTSQKRSYSASSAFTVAASASDVFTISGSATTTIKIYRISLYLTATAGSNATVFLIRRSSLNTGGTSTLLTNVALDTNNVASTAVVRSYTANPTLGTSVGNLIATGIYVSGGGTIGSNPFFWSFEQNDSQPIVLRGTSQLIAINLNAVTFAGNVARAHVFWTEE